MPQLNENQPLLERLLAVLKAWWKAIVYAVFRVNAKRFGGYIGPPERARRLQLVHHSTEFSVIRARSEIERQVDALSDFSGAQVKRIASGMSRVQAADPKQVDSLMAQLRSKNIVHHIYQVKSGGEEIAITDKVFVTLQKDDRKTIDEICERYRLLRAGRMGSAHILQVTDDSAVNPLKIANILAKRRDVKTCVPETLLPIMPANAVVEAAPPDLGTLAVKHNKLIDQWNLNRMLIGGSPVIGETKLSRFASINAHEAWKLVNDFSPGLFQRSEVIIAVIDDGFDFRHPAFGNPEPNLNGLDLVDGDDPSVKIDSHGTSVASIAAAKAHRMLGVAPCCELLPIRINFDDPNLLPEVLLEALTHASKNADVVNCSFEHVPEGFDRLNMLHQAFVEDVAKLIDNGGREKNGLVIVVSAGNFDAPTFLLGKDNKNGVKFHPQKPAIPAGSDVHTLYPEMPGVVVVGAMSSRKCKAGYSNWGEKLTVTAPSDNFHKLADRVDGFGTPDDYLGLGIVAAIGGPNPRYTDANHSFGGTSAAAPLVTGVIALMRSVNQKLKPKDIIEILQTQADRKDFPAEKLDVPDPNLKGFNLEFDANNRSIIFGAGKVDAAEAVREAIRRAKEDPLP